MGCLMAELQYSLRFCGSRLLLLASSDAVACLMRAMMR